MADVVTSDRTVGNWGRWGDDDERGALNLLTPDVVLRATQVCRTGKVYPLGLPVQRTGVPMFDYRGAPQRLTLTSQTDGAMYASYGAPPGLGANEDVLVVAAHHGTHMDAVCHVFADEKIYNGYPASDFASHTGASRCGVEKSAGFAGPAVLLDIACHQAVDWLEPGAKITGDDLESCRSAQGVELGAGDLLLFRTGWLDLFASLDGQPPPFAQPGLALSAVDFVRDNDLSLVGADNAAIECIPFDEDRFLSVHVELLVKLGVTLIEHLRLS